MCKEHSHAARGQKPFLPLPHTITTRACMQGTECSCGGATSGERMIHGWTPHLASKPAHAFGGDNVSPAIVRGTGCHEKDSLHFVLMRREHTTEVSGEGEWQMSSEGGCIAAWPTSWVGDAGEAPNNSLLCCSPRLSRGFCPSLVSFLDTGSNSDC